MQKTKCVGSPRLVSRDDITSRVCRYVSFFSSQIVSNALRSNRAAFQTVRFARVTFYETLPYAFISIG